MINKINNKILYAKATQLALAGIVAALLEAVFSIAFGIREEALTLFGFGIGSVLEIVSGIGIVFMIERIKNNEHHLNKMENLALKITGYSFYILAIGLIIGAGLSVYQHHIPSQNFTGVIIALASIIAMYVISKQKIELGNLLNSSPIIADGKCGMVCIYMSVVLLCSSAIYYFTGFVFADVIGSLALAYLCIKEGKECIEKLHGIECKH